MNAPQALLALAFCAGCFRMALCLSCLVPIPSEAMLCLLARAQGRRKRRAQR